MQTTGNLLAARYRLEEVIGRGGMSTVYRATDETLGRTVAVKLLLPTLAEEDPAYSARFEREARAAAALANPSVVTIYDTGVDAENRYIIMEYVEGKSLEEILRRGRPFEIGEALRIAARVADALAAAHAAGILHRDIKPANVMLTGTGNVKVLDFGIARRLDGTTITQVASVVGTAAYMAPERALGEPGDARADVYSLGCLLYAMLTGAAPFPGEVSAAVLHQQINAEPRPLSQLRGGVTPALDALVLSMLAKAPSDRPASALELRDRLLDLAGTAATVPVGEAAVATAATTPLTAATAPLAAGVTPSRWRALVADHRSRAVVMALLTAVITLIAVALLGGGGSSGSRTAPPARPRTTSSPPTTTHAPTTQSIPASTTPTTPAPNPKPEPKPKPEHKPKPPEHAPRGHGGEPPGHAKKH